MLKVYNIMWQFGRGNLSMEQDKTLLAERADVCLCTWLDSLMPRPSFHACVLRV